MDKTALPFDVELPWFCYEDHSGQPRASVTTDDTAADDANNSPVAHVLDRYMYRQWQMPSDAETYKIDFGADVSVQAIATVFPRITNPYRKYETQEILPTDLVQYWGDPDGGTPGAGATLNTGQFACGALADRGYSVIALDTAITIRYLEGRVHVPSRTAEGFGLVSLSMAGPIFQPTFPHIYGEKLGRPDNSEIQRTPSSQTGFVNRNERTLFAQLIWDFIPDSERASWDAMDDYAGNTEPILFALGSYNATTITSTTGPNAKLIEGDRVFVGNNQSDLSLTSRQYDANIKQIQLTEHR